MFVTLTFLRPVTVGAAPVFLLEDRHGQFEFSGTPYATQGTVSAQICREFHASFSHELRASALKRQQLCSTGILAWKAAGLPTET
jgi:hypothetical protein